MKRNITATAALAAAGLVLGTVTLGAQPALAEGGTVSPELRPRLELVCARVPNLQQGVQSRLDRIQAGADVRGSIAWLEAAKVKAQERNRTELAQLIADRIEVRTRLVPVLERRRQQLEKIGARCQELGIDA